MYVKPSPRWRLLSEAETISLIREGERSTWPSGAAVRHLVAPSKTRHNLRYAA